MLFGRWISWLVKWGHIKISSNVLLFSTFIAHINRLTYMQLPTGFGKSRGRWWKQEKKTIIMNSLFVSELILGESMRLNIIVNPLKWRNELVICWKGKAEREGTRADCGSGKELRGSVASWKLDRSVTLSWQTAQSFLVLSNVCLCISPPSPWENY